MDEILRIALINLRGMWQHRWLGLATTCIVGTLGFGAVLMFPEKYEASARIFVNTESILKPLMTGLTVTPNEDQRIVMLSRVVVSRPNVESLIQQVGMDKLAKSKDEYDRLVDNVIKLLQIKGTGRENLYTLSFRDVQPERAKKVVEIFSSMFIESSKGGKEQDTETAKRFIDEQIAVYEKKLQDAESRLKAFKMRYLGLTPGEGKDFYVRISETQNLLNQATLELHEAENARDALRRGLASEEPVPGAAPAVDSSMISDIDARIDAMKRNLDGLLQKYTDGHPDVVGARRVLRELEDQRRVLASQRKPGGPTLSSTLSGPRASETLKVSLAQSEASVASLRTRVAEYSGRLSRLKENAALVPQVEAEYAQLNRDYDVNKKNYESLVARRESAVISGEMQTVTGVSDFRLVDPPRVSPRPVPPNHRLLFPAVLVLSLLAGAAATFVAREARPTFFDGRAVREITGIPVLGVVSIVPNEPRTRAARANLLKFLGGTGAFIAAYLAGFIAIELLASRMG